MTFNRVVRKVCLRKDPGAARKRSQTGLGEFWRRNLLEAGPGKTKPPRLEHGWFIGGIKRSETHGEM